jgi:hypothetical protein
MSDAVQKAAWRRAFSGLHRPLARKNSSGACLFQRATQAAWVGQYGKNLDTERSSVRH